MRFCTGCGAQLEDGAKFCSVCGTPFPDMTPAEPAALAPPEKKSREAQTGPSAEREAAAVSGGQKQRAAVARALVMDPAIILADEPTGNLDEETGHQIVELLRHISAKGSAVVMTTHNLQLVRDFPGIVYRCDCHQIKDVTQEFYR